METRWESKAWQRHLVGSTHNPWCIVALRKTLWDGKSSRNNRRSAHISFSWFCRRSRRPPFLRFQKLRSNFLLFKSIVKSTKSFLQTYRYWGLSLVGHWHRSKGLIHQSFNWTKSSLEVLCFQELFTGISMFIKAQLLDMVFTALDYIIII